MAHSKARAADGKVTYPPGVKEISDKISKEEMVRRLKVSVFLPICCSHVSSVYAVVTHLASQYDITTLLEALHDSSPKIGKGLLRINILS